MYSVLCSIFYCIFCLIYLLPDGQYFVKMKISQIVDPSKYVTFIVEDLRRSRIFIRLTNLHSNYILIIALTTGFNPRTLVLDYYVYRGRGLFCYSASNCDCCSWSSSNRNWCWKGDKCFGEQHTTDSPMSLADAQISFLIDALISRMVPL